MFKDLSKAQRRRRRFDISFECRCRISWLQLQKGNVFQWCEVNTSQTRRESEERGVAKRKRLQVACAQSCFRHLWLRMLTKFAAKVLVFMACFGLKRVHNHGSQQCIRFQKQTPDLKIHSLINRPSLSFVFWKRSPTSFIEDEEGNHRLCLFSDSTWHFFKHSLHCAHEPTNAVQEPAGSWHGSKFLQIWLGYRASSRINEHEWTSCVSRGGKRRSNLGMQVSYHYCFPRSSLWKSNFFIQTTMMNCKQISQDVSISRSLLRSNGWRVPWRLSGGASVLPQKCRRFSNTPPLARPLWPISTAHELYVWRLGW